VAQAVRAVYEAGQLRVLDPVNLAEGQQVQLMILSEQERARAALADLVVPSEADTGDSADDAELVVEIDATLRGQVSVSEAIMQERWDGP